MKSFLVGTSRIVNGHVPAIPVGEPRNVCRCLREGLVGPTNITWLEIQEYDCSQQSGECQFADHGASSISLLERLL